MRKTTMAILFLLGTLTLGSVFAESKSTDTVGIFLENLCEELNVVNSEIIKALKTNYCARSVSIPRDSLGCSDLMVEMANTMKSTRYVFVRRLNGEEHVVLKKMEDKARALSSHFLSEEVHSRLGMTL